MVNKFTLSLVMATLAIALVISGSDSENRIDLNRAVQSDLERIPGIGPAFAGKIILERNRRGRFRSIDDLLKIRGIGRTTLAKLEKHVFIENAQTMNREETCHPVDASLNPYRKEIYND